MLPARLAETASGDVAFELRRISMVPEVCPQNANCSTEIRCNR